MRHVKLFESTKGDYAVWEKPVPGASYILGGDVALARDAWKKLTKDGPQNFGGGSGDTSTIIVLRREPFKLTQVFEGRARMEAGIFGEIVAAVGMHYNAALVNLERNIADAPFASLQRAQYPMERLFVPPDAFSSTAGFGAKIFTTKSKSNNKLLLDTLIDYLTFYTNRKNARLVLKSKHLVAELRELSKDEHGYMESTNSKDLAIALMMAVIADSMSPADLIVIPPPPKPPKPPWNVDPGMWKEAHGIKDAVPLNRDHPATWATGDKLPEFTEETPGWQGSD